MHAGLASVAVALVAVAAKGLISKAGKDRLTCAIMVASAAVSFIFAAPWLFPALILGGGAVTLLSNSLSKVDMALPVRPCCGCHSHSEGVRSETRNSRPLTFAQHTCGCTAGRRPLPLLCNSFL